MTTDGNDAPINLAAGLEVERLGIAPVRREELQAELVRQLRLQAPGPRSPVSILQSAAPKLVTLEAMAKLAESYRAGGRRVVLTNGCFDLLHVGHASYLKEAAAFGDVLVVAVNSDRSVLALKGPGRPVIPEKQRAAMLAALECVGHVLVFDDATPCELLRRIRPDVLVKGGTYTPDEVVGREIVESYGGRVCVTASIPGLSTTQILAAIHGHDAIPTPSQETAESFP